MHTINKGGLIGLIISCAGIAF